MIRPLELALESMTPGDAEISFVGRIHTPWREPADCPRQGSLDGPICRIELFEPFAPALAGIDAFSHLQVLYWLDRSRRDLLRQRPHGRGEPVGTFALRSPLRPNPIGVSLVRLVAVDGADLSVRGLDCVDGTPLIDLKPERCHHGPSAAPR